MKWWRMKWLQVSWCVERRDTNVSNQPYTAVSVLPLADKITMKEFSMYLRAFPKSFGMQMALRVVSGIRILISIAQKKHFFFCIFFVFFFVCLSFMDCFLFIFLFCLCLFALSVGCVGDRNI